MIPEETFAVQPNHKTFVFCGEKLEKTFAVGNYLFNFIYLFFIHILQHFAGINLINDFFFTKHLYISRILDSFFYVPSLVVLQRFAVDIFKNILLEITFAADSFRNYLWD